MENNNYSGNEVGTLLLLKFSGLLFVLLIVLIGIVKSCIGDNIEPMDNSINKTREIVAHLDVRDSTYNGFRVSYVTVKSVTKERLAEIRSRPHIRETFAKIRQEAPGHFNEDLLHADIYDFATFVLKYELDPAIEIHNIFIEGKEKCNLYVQPNPKIANYVSWFNVNTEQGALYLKKDDVYYRSRKESRIYRYWKCFGLHSTSSTDEQFSHFSEAEKLW